MATIVRDRFPVQEFVLADALEALPDAELETERIVDAGDDAVMPLLWVRGVDAVAFEAACGDDDTVGAVTLLADLGDEYLYRMDWIDRVELLLEMITNGGATVLDAYGADSRWHLRVLYPSREALSDAQQFCEEHDIDFEVVTLRELEGQPTGRYGLTREQHETLLQAVELGYFEVPREADLDEFADELGISYQALSERIQRGCRGLIEDALMVGVASHRLRRRSE